MSVCPSAFYHESFTHFLDFSATIRNLRSRPPRTRARDGTAHLTFALRFFTLSSTSRSSTIVTRFHPFFPWPIRLRFLTRTSYRPHPRRGATQAFLPHPFLISLASVEWTLILAHPSAPISCLRPSWSSRPTPSLRPAARRTSASGAHHRGAPQHSGLA
ncbi:hypothetical protein B0H13DRAFT_1112640 [Mycena leptocephala]|nr:hypothetical protein B0H13DRAFT_1112640 [Mycena leptocephala]